ncbi:hypothetical protein LPJ70_003509, partial [Coemansia sp. RSA 2708]
MADFGYDWGDGDEGAATTVGGVVVHRVAASDRQANPHGTTESELLEPMIEDKAKELQVQTLESAEEQNLGALETFCQRAASVFIFQRVWAAKEAGRLLGSEARGVGLGVLVPAAMQLAEDRELFVRETMAQELEPVLHYYYAHRRDPPEPAPPPAEGGLVPPARVPSGDEFGAWLHRVLLAPHPSVSLPAQRAAVALGRRLAFDVFHTEIVHGVVLGLVRNPVHAQLLRAKDMVVKARGEDGSDGPEKPDGTDGPKTDGSRPDKPVAAGVLASLFGRRSWQSEPAGSDSEPEPDDGPAAFFVSPADEAARLELTRRKLLMLHMVHLVAAEFGAAMRPAVFVPVVERAAKDRTFEVRRDAAAVLGSLARAVSNDLAMDVLFASFLQLAQDAVWQVRQSAARHALPGLALVLAARGSRPESAGASARGAASERRHALQQYAGATGAAPDRGPGAADSDDALAAFAFRNQPARAVPDRQWLQLVERLGGSREPSAHVRAAVFEAAGRLALALADCPRARDALVALVVGDVQRACGAGGAARLGSSASLQSLDEDDDDAEPDAEAAAAAEEAAVLARALASVHGAAPPVPPAARTARAVGRDALYHAAFNFPALLAALGAQGWDRLRDAYMQLSRAEHYGARQTLACSLHEVARLLASGTACALAASARLASNRVSAGGAQAASPLLPFSADLESVLCLFLIDGAEVKMGALRHLGDTLTWLTPASRVRCLPMIMQVFRHDGAQWRTRELMAAQLVKLCHLFPASVVAATLLPQAVAWAHDPVAGVRAAVAPAFPIVFALTKLDPATQVRFFETVISFSHAASFRGRLFFVEICAALLAHDQDPDADPVDFDQFFLPSLAALAADRVANVRIALARLVRRMLENRMRRQSISATLADMWAPPPARDDWVDQEPDLDPQSNASPARRPSQLHAVHRSRRRSSSARRQGAARKRSNTRDSVASDATTDSNSCGARPRHVAHRSLGSLARRPRRNTTPMRAHLLATM